MKLRDDSPTTVFYVPPELIDGRDVRLPPEEGRHVVRVLRHRPGDDISVVDGTGMVHHVRLTSVRRDAVEGAILYSSEGHDANDVELTLGIGLLKSRSRMEFLLEKAVELGVRRIYPLVCRRSERVRLDSERSTRVLQAAMKQSCRTRLAELHPPGDFAEFVSRAPEGLALVCDERASANRALTSVIASEMPHPVPVTILVGPEGGFEAEETSLAVERGYRPVSLGPTRLRSETAALVALSAIRLRLGEASTTPVRSREAKEHGHTSTSGEGTSHES